MCVFFFSAKGGRYLQNDGAKFTVKFTRLQTTDRKAEYLVGVAFAHILT